MSDIVEKLRTESSVQLAFGQDLSILLDAALEIERLREALAKIASQSPSTPSKMLIEYASAAFSQSVMRINNERV